MIQAPAMITAITWCNRAVVGRVGIEADRAAIQRLATMLAFLEGATAAEAPESFRYFVAAENDNIVGFAALDKWSDTSAQLVSLYISGGWRRQGLGRQLVLTAIGALGQGCELSVLVAPTNPAIALFRKLGFSPVTHLGEYQTPGDHLHLSLKIV
jgi:ribosomal protein S18 acetylase RimI-like enzyme